MFVTRCLQNHQEEKEKDGGDTGSSGDAVSGQFSQAPRYIYLCGWVTLGPPADDCNIGDGSEWLETETLNYYHDQNQCQTLAVLGGMVLIMYDTHADEFWVSGHVLSNS